MRNLKREVDGFSQGKRATAQTISQGFAFEQLGDYIGRAFVFPNVKNGQNIGMVQGGRGPGLLGEPLQAIGVGGKSRGPCTPRPYRRRQFVRQLRRARSSVRRLSPWPSIIAFAADSRLEMHFRG